MAAPQAILAIDQGTTSTRAILFGRDARVLAVSQREFPQIYPQSGWVEHDAETIWRDTLATAREAVEKAGGAANLAAIGITNQRETVVVWDRATGEPIHNAIVWQDRRTAETCARLKAEGVEPLVTDRTGLLLDPYFSATKLAWILDQVPEARTRAERGELAFGTIESFLLWRLTGGAVHATDLTNAGRTLLCDIARGNWDEELLRLFRVPRAMLPEIRGNSEIFGHSAPEWFGVPIPIGGLAGDQQAALIGQTCFEPGMVKSTYGTGCFMLMNAGKERPWSGNRLLVTPAYRLGGETTYAMEGSIFIAGAAIKWLRDRLGILTDAGETAALAQSLSDNGGVYLVPAFVGLGAPHWEPNARGLLTGLTLEAGPAHFARAALESVVYQTADLGAAMEADMKGGAETLRVDGGMAVNDWFCQYLADILDVPVERPASVETTALGAAFLAGLATGVWSGLSDIATTWSLDRRFEPRMGAQERERALTAWRDAVRRTLLSAG